MARLAVNAPLNGSQLVGIAAPLTAKLGRLPATRRITFMETRFCLVCDKEFTPRAREDEFCSQECAQDYEAYYNDDFGDAWEEEDDCE